MKPELLTNRPGEVVADGIRGYLEHLRETLRDPFELAIATAYFNLGGWHLVADELQHPKTIRLLLGAEPPDPERRVRQLDVVHDRSERQQVQRALEGHDRDLQAEADLLGFTSEAATGASKLIEWLRSERVEVRRLPDRFLHGKAWIVSDNAEGAVVGSANFTYAGLTTNLELALGNYDPHVVKGVRSWFDELWGGGRAVRPSGALRGALRAAPAVHDLPADAARALRRRARGGSGRDGGRRDPSDPVPARWRLAREADPAAAQRCPDRRRGRLGKTFLAGELIREAVQERRQRVLVIAPAALRDGPWRKFLLDPMLGGEVRLVRGLAVAREREVPARGLRLGGGRRSPQRPQPRHPTSGCAAPLFSLVHRRRSSCC